MNIYVFRHGSTYAELIDAYIKVVLLSAAAASSDCSSSLFMFELIPELSFVSIHTDSLCCSVGSGLSTALTSFTNKSLTLCYRVQKKQVAPIASIIETSVWVWLTEQKWSQNVRESGCPEVQASMCLFCRTVGPRNVKIFYLNSHIQEITRRSCSCSRLRA